jgi:hypothetical protein
MSEHARLHEEKESLWVIAISPTIWAGHFLLSYAVAAIWCAKVAGRDGSLGAARWAIVALTAAALLCILVVGRAGWRAHRYPGGSQPHDEDTAEDRHRLLGLAAVLLSSLSAVAVVFEALVLVFVRTCA